jgi:hypothetical protein
MTDAERTEALDARAHGLPWRTSMVDLLKVLELDFSEDARRTLASDLGYAIPFTGTAEDNRWLHHRVLDEIAKHGIKIPR